MRPDGARAPRGVARLVLAALVASGGPAATATDPPDPRLEPYTARYQVSYRGLAGGQVESSLKPGGAPGIWLYATRAYPNFLGRMAFSSAASSS